MRVCACLATCLSAIAGRQPCSAESVLLEIGGGCLRKHYEAAMPSHTPSKYHYMALPCCAMGYRRGHRNGRNLHGEKLLVVVLNVVVALANQARHRQAATARQTMPAERIAVTFGMLGCRLRQRAQAHIFGGRKKWD